MPARRPTSSSLTVLAAAGASLTLAGCLAHDPFAPPVDPNSPAAQRVAEAARKDLPYPRWSEFPAAPRDVPAPAEFAERVADAEAAEAALKAAAAGLVWTLDDSEGWATATRSHIDRSLAQPAPADARAQSEAWAAEMRAKAAPPPIVK